MSAMLLIPASLLVAWLCLHLPGWRDRAARRIQGGGSISRMSRAMFQDPERPVADLVASKDWQGVDTSPEAYAEDRAELAENRLWMASRMEFAEARAEGGK